MEKGQVAEYEIIKWQKEVADFFGKQCQNPKITFNISFYSSMKLQKKSYYKRHINNKKAPERLGGST